jgi:hypothetical protein
MRQLAEAKISEEKACKIKRVLYDVYWRSEKAHLSGGRTNNEWREGEMKKFLLASVVATAVFVAQAQAQIVFYSFNTNGFTGAVLTTAQSNTIITANIGSSISSFTNQNSVGGGFSTMTILSSTGGNPNNRGFAGGNSVSQNGWNGNNSYFQFTLDATGYQNIMLSWAGNISGTGPTNTGIWYSSDGGANFTLFNTIASVLNTFSTTQDLSSVTTLNNNALDVFRLYGTNVTGVAIAAGGTMKIDNFAIDATVVPEPSTMVLVGAGLLGLLASRRRRS